eukprot:jgi/Ulvmu1/481/UM001_0489.1
MTPSTESLVADRGIRVLLHRLSRDAELPVSASFLRNTENARDPQVLHAHLESLLVREPGIFLERYGMTLSMTELQPFQDLSDSTVQHYVRQYISVIQSSATPSVPKAVKNRRFAMMKKLDAGGSYFSMESMRQRDPILYHEYVGQLPWPGMDTSPVGSGESCKLSERIMRQHEGLEQARCLQAATLRQEEHSSQAAEEAVPLQTVFPGSAGAPASPDPQSPRGDTESVATFETLMRERFLGGGDAKFVDYGEIDKDASLDDFWAREEALDAQEKYFDDVS